MHEVAFSVAAQALVCWRCYSRQPEAQSTGSTESVTPSPQPRSKPTEYAKLVDRVWKALENAAVERTGSSTVFGGGDPSLPLMGWCPVCKRGTVAVWLISNAEPPEVDVEACTAGCSSGAVAKALR